MAKDIEIPKGINLESWAEWIEYRKDKRKPVSHLAANKQFKLLLKYDAEEQQAVIDKSIQNDYQGLFEIKGQGNAKNQQRTPIGQTKRETASRQSERDLDTLRRSAEQSHHTGRGVVRQDGGDLWLTLDNDTGKNC